MLSWPPIALAVSLLLVCEWTTALQVTPPHVRLQPGHMSAELRLRNTGDKAVSVQASLERWNQDAQGRDIESPAEDLAFYPKLFVIQPGGTQVIRVGRLQTAAVRPQTELAYRLSLRELPVESAEGSVAILRKLRLPVWLLPDKPQSQWAIAALQRGTPERSTATDTEGFQLLPLVANAGNVHQRLTEIRVVALDATGAVLREGSAQGWYVLAGIRRGFAVTVAPDFCSGTATVRVQVRGSDGAEQLAQWPAAEVCP